MSLHSSAALPDIEPVSEEWRALAQQRLDSLTKPLGSLGQLEAIAAQCVAIRRERWADRVQKGVYIFAADHGVTAEGVSAYPGDVTRQMVLNFLAGGAAINVLARLHQAELAIIDVGVVGAFDDAAGLVQRKVAAGTRNLRYEAAMSEEELACALAAGAEMADRALAEGHNIVAIGEMGIGNTTAAAAITCALTGIPASRATGYGTGVLSPAYARKIEVVEAAVSRHCGHPPNAPRHILQCLGGLEIAAMVGMILQSARHRCIIVIDGFIATSAAAIAVALVPDALGYLIAGHCSQEPGHAVLLDHLGLRPLLSLAMRLGEGTGAVLAMPLVESALALYREMATFESAGVSVASR